jgi:hypothetical protein
MVWPPRLIEIKESDPMHKALKVTKTAGCVDIHLPADRWRQCHRAGANIPATCFISSSGPVRKCQNPGLALNTPAYWARWRPWSWSGSIMIVNSHFPQAYPAFRRPTF